MPDAKAHIAFLVSSHGLGHLGQVAAVIDSLRQLAPDLSISVGSQLAKDIVRQFLPDDVAIVEAPEHATIAMNGPLEVDVSKTETIFQNWHDHIDDHIIEFSRWLGDLKPDLVVSDVDYTIFPAAQRCGVKAIAMCSLNWSEILRPMLPVTETNMAVCESIDRYNDMAHRFFALEPAMPMPALNNSQNMPFVARRGNAKGVRQALALRDDQRLIMYTMGGIEQVLDVQHWQVPDNTVWVLPDNLAIDAPWCLSQRQCGRDYIDLLAAADVLCTKPGYGSFTEACVNDTAVVYVRRHGWPEEAVLLEWLQQFDRCRSMSHEDFIRGNFKTVVESSLDDPVKPSIPLCGNDVVAGALLRCLTV